VNYFAHGRALLARPLALAGAARPDWLAACDRRARLRRARVPADGGEIAAGVLRHLDDDAWFHTAPAFLASSAEITARLRAAAPDEPTFRAGFWGHVLTEILLDAALMQEEPGALDRYYAALDRVDARTIVRAAAGWTTQPPRRLDAFIDLFRRARFLYGYATDRGLRARLDGLARRVGLPPLPVAAVALLPALRRVPLDAGVRDALDARDG
jgi:hypothetical protein